MSLERLEHLLNQVAPYIVKKKCNSRIPLSPGERLVVTLRYLATGDSQQSQAFNFRLGKSTVCNIIKETCSGLWNALSASYLKAPNSENKWKQIANEMFSQWDFPNCIGALDGKHVAIECPANSGSNFFNYKKFYSIVLMAMCDARYCFTLVDIGNNGRDNDAQIFNNSAMGKALSNNELNVPSCSSIDGHTLPYVVVSDEIFALKPWLLKPYGGKRLPQDNEIFNYRLSRCRRTIENSFGILAARWRIFRRPIKAKPETVDLIIKACLCLHNYLQLTYNAHYIPAGFVDAEDSTGNFIPGNWRNITMGDIGAMEAFTVGRANNRSSFEANEVRETFKKYFISREGSLSWQ
ncbi:Hypothetical predicted protein, partial [Paramuricea clavata]